MNEEQVINQIFAVVRDRLYIDMRFLDVALNSFSYEGSKGVDVAATDGFTIFYHGSQLGRLYYQSPLLVNRLYLHIVFHCLFRHPAKTEREDTALWKLACDITVEALIDSLHVKSVKAPSTWQRKETCQRLEQKLQVYTPEAVYRCLQEWELTSHQVDLLDREFSRDDHQLWYGNGSGGNGRAAEKWKNISEKAETDMDTFSKEAASDAGRLLGHLQVENQERYDYREFLSRFSVLREEMRVDEDSFDYGFYSYGLSLYGNMPLIEPQEWREVKKIEEFVIVIDTSMSCQGELVRGFLEETYDVLKQNDSFFKHTDIHIIQCDEAVQSDIRIGGIQELQDYMEALELRGSGGTDFRPAFEYVEALQEKGELDDLRGLLYFTDGKGSYPGKKPPYETAFVFLRELPEDIQVPPWALKILLNEDSLTEGIKRGY